MECVFTSIKVSYTMNSIPHHAKIPVRGNDGMWFHKYKRVVYNEYHSHHAKNPFTLPSIKTAGLPGLFLAVVRLNPSVP